MIQAKLTALAIQQKLQENKWPLLLNGPLQIVINEVAAALLKASEDAKREVLERLPSSSDTFLFLDAYKNRNKCEISAMELDCWLRDRLTNGETK